LKIYKDIQDMKINSCICVNSQFFYIRISDCEFGVQKDYKLTQFCNKFILISLGCLYILSNFTYQI